MSGLFFSRGCASVLGAVLCLVMWAPLGAHAMSPVDVKTNGRLLQVAAPPPSEAAADSAFPIGPAVGAGVGSACGAVTGLVTAGAIVGAIVALAGVPGEAGDAASGALAAGAFFYSLPVIALPPIGAATGAFVGGLLTGVPLETAAVHAAFAGGTGFCGSLACALPSWWLVAIPFLVAVLTLGDAILLPGLFVALGAFVPIWATAGGVVAGAGPILSHVSLGSTPASEVETPRTAAMRF